MNLCGELDMGTTTPLQEASKAAVAGGDYDTLVFDLTQLTFIDSTGLHLLTEVHREMAAKGGSTRVVCPNANLLKVFELTGLTSYLTIVPERADAFELAA